MVSYPAVDKIYGRWSLYKITGGMAGGFKYPAAKGYHQEMEITRDGKFRIFYNGKLMQESAFKIDRFIKGSVTVYRLITTGNRQDFIINKVQNDTLSLTDKHMEADKEIYTRLK